MKIMNFPFLILSILSIFTCLGMVQDNSNIEIHERVTLQKRGNKIESINSLDFSPDGKKLAIGTGGGWSFRIWGFPGEVKIWDVKTGKLLEKSILKFKKKVNAVSFSPNGNNLAIGTDGGRNQCEVMIYDLSSGNVNKTFEVNRGSVYSVKYSPDNKLLASCGVNKILNGLGEDDQNQGELIIWDLKTKKDRFRYNLDKYKFFSLSFSPDGRIAAVGGGREFIGTTLFGLKIHRESGFVELWDIAKGEEKGSIEGLTAVVESVSFSPDGKTLALAMWDGTIKLWNIEEGKEETNLKPKGGARVRVTSVTFSPDGNLLASGMGCYTRYHCWGEVQLWDVKSKTKIVTLLNGHPKPITSVAFSPSGKILAAGSWDSTLKLWDIVTKEERKSIKELSLQEAIFESVRHLAPPPLIFPQSEG